MSGTTTITLQSVECVQTSEPGKDEVFIKYKIDKDILEKRFPDKGYYSLAPGDVWTTDLPLTFKESVVVWLCDNDGIGDDNLGSATYYPDTPQPDAVSISNPNGADYVLNTIAG
jgi:hypothetical protein